MVDPNGAWANGAAKPHDNGSMMDLKSHIDSKECYARNVNPRFPMTNLFIGDSTLGCKSDMDEQLILHVAFNEFVKVHSIKLTEFARGLEAESNPTVVKIFANRESMGFEDCEDIDPTQVLELRAEDLKEGAKSLALKFVKFQRVHSLTIFVQENTGGDVSALGGLKVFGRAVLGTNMSEFKKQG